MFDFPHQGFSQTSSHLHCCTVVYSLSSTWFPVEFSSTVKWLVYPCSSLMSRTAEEVPWQLQRADLKKELYHTVLNVDILLQLYSGSALTPSHTNLQQKDQHYTLCFVDHNYAFTLIGLVWKLFTFTIVVIP